MLRSRHGLALFLSAAAVCAGDPQSANAKLTEDALFALRFDGFHLGMKRSELDKIIASRTDISEPAIAEMTAFDCGYLAASSNLAPPSDIYSLPRDVGFSATGGRSYGVRFDPRPDEDAVYDLEYRERRGIGEWPIYLSELEARFGKADQVGKARDGYMFALWCTGEAGDCSIESRPKRPQLSVRLYPHGPTLVYPGDTLSYQLLEGRELHDARRDTYSKLRSTDPQRAEKLYRQCVSQKGKFPSEEEAKYHYVSLMPMGRSASKFRWTANSIPPAIFSALGFDGEKISGPGVCFQSMDFFTELPGCSSYSNVSFRWARKVDRLWLISLHFGGISLRTQYFVVREGGKNEFRQIWSGEDLTDFSAWLANGAVPMAETKLR